MAGYDREWEFSWGIIHLSIELFDFMIGIAFGPRDVLIRPLPFVIIGIEWFPAEAQ